MTIVTRQTQSASHEPVTIDQDVSVAPMLFVVWIDSNCGIKEIGADWEMNSAHLCPAKPLHDALDEAAECQTGGYPTVIMPEGQTPRADGLFSNPLTDP